MRTIRKEIVLIAPPFSTTSSPYISLPALKGWLNKGGITTRLVDLARDIEYTLLCPDTIKKAYNLACERFFDLNGKDFLLPSQAYQLIELQMLLRHLGPVYEDWQKDDFRDGDKNLLMELVSAPHWPNSLSSIGGLQLRSGYSVYSSYDLIRSAEDVFFFTPHLRNLIKTHIDGDRTLIAGISVVFDQQVIPALQCARIIKELHPGIHVTLGGPFVTIHLRHLENLDFFKYIDSYILDEGEEPLVALHSTMLKERPDFAAVPNLVWVNAAGAITRNPSTSFIDLARIPAPDYGACELDRYPDAKNMQLIVRLSKGCYWRRCAFCRVNLSLCHNYSQPNATNVYQSLCEVIDSTGVTKYLFSDESCSPEILEEISEKLCTDGRKISWTFHTRIDSKRLSRQRVEKFKEAGCTGFTVGIETFNDRLLKLLNKGITEKEIELVLHDLKDLLPINAYMMIGLPTETEEEYHRSFETIRLFRQNGLLASVHYSLFYLSPGSLMWKRPERYGISRVDSFEGEDLMPNNITNFTSEGMSRFTAFKLYLSWMRRKIPPQIHEMPVLIHGEKYYSRYHAKYFFENAGELFIKQLDIPYLAWLDQLDQECAPPKGRDPWWMIGD